MKKIKYSSLFLPNQPLLKKYFKLKNFEDHLYSFIAKYSNIITPKKKYKLFNPSGIAVEEMASNPISLSFLNFICYLIKPKNILEIGSFIGLSTMELSTHLKKNGKVWNSNLKRGLSIIDGLFVLFYGGSSRLHRGLFY